MFNCKRTQMDLEIPINPCYCYVTLDARVHRLQQQESDSTDITINDSTQCHLNGTVASALSSNPPLRPTPIR